MSVVDGQLRKQMSPLKDRLKGRFITIITPCYGGVDSMFATSMFPLAHLIRELGADCGFIPLQGHANNSRSRCMLVAQALSQPDCTDVVFIDSDIGFEPIEFFKLFTPAYGEIGVLGGVPERRGFSLDDPRFAWSSGAPVGELEINRYGHFRAKAATAFLRIERQAFETIAKKRPDLKWEHDNFTPEQNAELYAYFRWGLWQPPTLDHNIFEGEDFSFCRLAEECGVECWVDPSIRLAHIDRIVRTGALCDHLPNEVAAARENVMRGDTTPVTDQRDVEIEMLKAEVARLKEAQDGRSEANGKGAPGFELHGGNCADDDHNIAGPNGSACQHDSNA